MIRVLLFAVCFKPLRDRYPSMFDAKIALQQIDACIAEDGYARLLTQSKAHGLGHE